MKFLRNTCIRFLLLVIAFPISARAQSVTLTGPTSTVTTVEAEEYGAKTGNRYDFNELRDMGWDQYMSSINIANGVLQCVASQQSAFLLPLFHGFSNNLPIDFLDGEQGNPRTGRLWPVNGAEHPSISMRIRTSNPSSMRINWATEVNWPFGGNGGTAQVADNFQGMQHNGFKIFDLDMAAGAQFSQFSGSWQNSTIYSWGFVPSEQALGGSLTELDWVRVYNPATAGRVNVTWNATGTSVGAHVITVWVDDDDVGFDGTPIAHFLGGSGNPGTYLLNLGALPPGDNWRAYVTVRLRGGASFGNVIARTAYSGRIVILPRPDAYFGAPSPVSNEDYFEVKQQNPANFDSLVDLRNLTDPLYNSYVWQLFSSPTIIDSQLATDGKLFYAQANPPLAPAPHSDVQVHQQVTQAAPIETDENCYGVVRADIGIPANVQGYSTLPDRVANGYVMRPFVSWNTDVASDFYTRGFVIYEGMRTYWVDLCQDKDTIAEWGKGSWQSFGQLYNTRLDVGEFTIPGVNVPFSIDYVKLMSKNRPVRTSSNQDIYTLTVEVPASSASNTFTLRVYYDTDKTGFNGTLIETRNVAAGSHSFSWNMTALQVNTPYYPYVEITDANGGVQRRYALVPVYAGVRGPSGRSGRAPNDFNGDGISDYVVYRRGPDHVSPGYYFFVLSGSGFAFFPWGALPFTPVAADFDGDGTSDPGLVFHAADLNTHYYSALSSKPITDPQRIYFRSPFGVEGDIPVIADYNGNGREEYGIARRVTASDSMQWFISDEDNVMHTYTWGLAGDIPVPEDYDGDGKVDLAVWRPSDGTWNVLRSSDNTPWVRQWGLNGDIPVPADWNGDGKADPSIFRQALGPEIGMWYLRLEDSQGQVSVESRQFGLWYHYPLIGDYDGDGVLDLTAFDPSTYYFHTFFRGTGQFRSTQLGLPGDLIPQRVGR